MGWCVLIVRVCFIENKWATKLWARRNTKERKWPPNRKNACRVSIRTKMVDERQRTPMRRLGPLSRLRSHKTRGEVETNEKEEGIFDDETQTEWVRHTYRQTHTHTNTRTHTHTQHKLSPARERENKKKRDYARYILPLLPTKETEEAKSEF
jgi:hypothetical protein